MGAGKGGSLADTIGAVVEEFPPGNGLGIGGDKKIQGQGRGIKGLIAQLGGSHQAGLVKELFLVPKAGGQTALPGRFLELGQGPGGHGIVKSQKFRRQRSPGFGHGFVMAQGINIRGHFLEFFIPLFRGHARNGIIPGKEVEEGGGQTRGDIHQVGIGLHGCMGPGRITGTPAIHDIHARVGFSHSRYCKAQGRSNPPLKIAVLTPIAAGIVNPFQGEAHRRVTGKTGSGFIGIGMGLAHLAHGRQQGGQGSITGRLVIVQGGLEFFMDLGAVPKEKVQGHGPLDICGISIGGPQNRTPAGPMLQPVQQALVQGRGQNMGYGGGRGGKARGFTAPGQAVTHHGIAIGGDGMFHRKTQFHLPTRRIIARDLPHHGKLAGQTGDRSFVGIQGIKDIIPGGILGHGEIGNGITGFPQGRDLIGPQCNPLGQGAAFQGHIGEHILGGGFQQPQISHPVFSFQGGGISRQFGAHSLGDEHIPGGGRLAHDRIKGGKNRRGIQAVVHDAFVNFFHQFFSRNRLRGGQDRNKFNRRKIRARIKALLRHELPDKGPCIGL